MSSGRTASPKEIGHLMIRNETINFSRFLPLPVFLVSMTLLVLSLGAAIEANAGEAALSDREACPYLATPRAHNE
jgi:hypothetical protein